MSKYPDLNLIKQRFLDSSSPKETLSLRIEKPQKEGEKSTTKVRILPNPHNENGWFFTDVYFHYNVGSPFACPKFNFKQVCPFCEHVKDIYDKCDEIAREHNVDPKNLEEKKRLPGVSQLFAAAKQLAVKKRVYVPVLLRDKEPNEIKYWGMSPTLGDELFGDISGRKKNILDIERGFDTIITFKNDGSQFGKITFKFELEDDPTPVLPNASFSEIDKFIDTVPNIWGTLVKKTTTEEAMELFNSRVNVLTNVVNTGKSAVISGAGSQSTPAPEAPSVTDNVLSSLRSLLDD